MTTTDEESYQATLWCDLGPAVPICSSGIIPPFVSRQSNILAASDNHFGFKISRKQIIGRLLEQCLCSCASCCSATGAPDHPP